MLDQIVNNSIPKSGLPTSDINFELIIQIEHFMYLSRIGNTDVMHNDM